MCVSLVLLSVIRLKPPALTGGCLVLWSLNGIFVGKLSISPQNEIPRKSAISAELWGVVFF